MREILFRGKRVEDGKWIYGYLSFFYIDNPKKGRMYSPKEVRRFDVMSETVTQYTGLTDKNGVKIFEGDIVKGASEYFGNGSLNQKAVVLYDKGQFLLSFGDTLAEYDKLEDVEVVGAWHDDIVVIGNIYDNPELIESQL